VCRAGRSAGSMAEGVEGYTSARLGSRPGMNRGRPPKAQAQLRGRERARPLRQDGAEGRAGASPRTASAATLRWAATRTGTRRAANGGRRTRRTEAQGRRRLARPCRGPRTTRMGAHSPRRTPPARPRRAAETPVPPAAVLSHWWRAHLLCRAATPDFTRDSVRRRVGQPPRATLQRARASSPGTSPPHSPTVGVRRHELGTPSLRRTAGVHCPARAPHGSGATGVVPGWEVTA
jgi:hypothetical protein